MSIIKRFEGKVSGEVHVISSDARTVVVCSPDFCSRAGAGEPVTINGIEYTLHLTYRWRPSQGCRDAGWALDYIGVTRRDANGGFGSYGTYTDGCRAAISEHGVIGLAAIEAAQELIAHGALWAAEGASISTRRERLEEQIETLTVKVGRMRLAQLDAEGRADGDAPKHTGAYRCKCERHAHGSPRWPGEDVGPGADYSHDVTNCERCAGAVGVTS